jgi:hypothetical protein
MAKDGEKGGRITAIVGALGVAVLVIGALTDFFGVIPGLVEKFHKARCAVFDCAPPLPPPPRPEPTCPALKSFKLPDQNVDGRMYEISVTIICVPGQTLQFKYLITWEWRPSAWGGNQQVTFKFISENGAVLETLPLGMTRDYKKCHPPAQKFEGKLEPAIGPYIAGVRVSLNRAESVGRDQGC